MSRTNQLAFVAAGFVMFSMVPGSALGQYVYWRDDPLNGGGEVYRVRTDGTNQQHIGDGDWIGRISFDPVDRKMYFTHFGGPREVRRANDVGAAEELVFAFTTEIPTEIKVDAYNRKIYCVVYDTQVNPFQWRMRRMNLDGTGNELLFVFPPSSETAPISSFDLDLPSQSIIWAFAPSWPQVPQLWRASLDGSNRQTVAQLDSWRLNLTVDPVHRSLYWATNLDARPIYKMRLGEWVSESIHIADSNTGLAVDPVHQKVYWSERDLEQINEMDLDGADAQTLVISSDLPALLGFLPYNDCNGNEIDDWCEISCGTSGGYCDVPGCGLKADCDHDGLLNECEVDPPLDCNANSIDDRCDIANGSSTDCDVNFVPDECDGSDCNANGLPDRCDLAVQTSPDCNSNELPDECDLASSSSLDCNSNDVPDECDLDCNGNQVPDDCDIAAETSTDCDQNQVPDECELSLHDCNGNNIHDACDISGGFSQDVNNDGFPDECIAALLADPVGINKSRFISFVIPPAPGEVTALRINMVALHNVVPPYGGSPTIPFDLFEGLAVWVGPPATFVESTASGVSFISAATQCQPHYQDWSTVGLLHVRGSHIVPSSVYQVQQVSDACEGQEEACSQVSPQLEIRTTRWADVVTPFNPPSPTAQADLGDAAAIINKFRGQPGALIKARSLIAPSNEFGEISVAQMSVDVGFTSIASALDGFRGWRYPAQMGKCANSSVACTNHTDCGANGPCNLYCP